MSSKFGSAVRKYQDKLKCSKRMLATSFGRSLLGRNGVATKLFLAYVFEDAQMGMEFLRDCGLLRSEMPCPKCGANMTLSKRACSVNEYNWTCRQKTTKRCRGCRSVRHGSWFMGHVKATLPVYNRQNDYILYLSEYMFRKKCKSEGCDPFNKFMDIVAAAV